MQPVRRYVLHNYHPEVPRALVPCVMLPNPPAPGATWEVDVSRHDRMVACRPKAGEYERVVVVVWREQAEDDEQPDDSAIDVDGTPEDAGICPFGILCTVTDFEREGRTASATLRASRRVRLVSLKGKRPAKARLEAVEDPEVGDEDRDLLEQLHEIGLDILGATREVEPFRREEALDWMRSVGPTPGLVDLICELFAGPRTTRKVLLADSLDERITHIEPIVADLAEETEDAAPAPIPPRPPRKGLTRLRLNLRDNRKNAETFGSGLVVTVKSEADGLSVFDPAVLAPRLLNPPADWWSTATVLQRSQANAECMVAFGLPAGSYLIALTGTLTAEPRWTGEVEVRSGLLFLGGVEALDAQFEANLADPVLEYARQLDEKAGVLISLESGRYRLALCQPDPSFLRFQLQVERVEEA